MLTPLVPPTPAHEKDSSAISRSAPWVEEDDGAHEPDLGRVDEPDCGRLEDEERGRPVVPFEEEKKPFMADTGPFISLVVVVVVVVVC